MIEQVRGKEEKMRLREYRVKIEALASTPKELCWVHHDQHGDSENDYCYDCALVAIGKLTQDEKVARKFCKDTQNPNWGLCKKEDVWLDRSHGSWESDGCRHCVTCGAHLDVSLLEIREEIGHFQACVTKPSANEWAHWLDVIESIEYVEKSWFPLESMSKERAAEQKDLYDQVLKETRRLLSE